ncbi:uncharacterized protein BDZ99DRAFT_351970, partial [Mytilinidion resinicola]
DFGKAIGIHKDADIPSKIKKWQTEGGGMIPVDDPAAGAVTEDESTEAVDAIATAKGKMKEKEKEKAAESPKPKKAAAAEAASPARSPKKLAHNKLDEDVRIASAPKKLAHNKLDEDVRIASAPKKRVVSDSNWRKNKSPPKDGAAARPDVKLPVGWVRPAVKHVSPTKPKVEARPPPIKITPRIVRTRTAVRRKSRPGSSGNEERPKTSGSDSVIAEKSDSSPASPCAAEKKEAVKLRGGDGRIRSPRVYLSADDEAPVKRRSSRRVDRSPTEEAIHDDTPPEKSPAFDSPLASGSRRRRRSGGHKIEQTLRESEEPTEDPPSTERRRLRKKSYQIDVPDVARPPEPEVAPETPPKVYGNRIEAWLTTTPDPFLDSETKSRRSSKSTVSTSDVSRPKTEVSSFTESSISREESVLEKPDRASSSRRRARTRTITVDTRDMDDRTSSHPSIAPSEITDSAAGGDGTPSPSLKRRGAKRSSQSPTKNRSKSLSSRDPPTVVDTEDEVSVAPSSSVDASTFQLPDLPIRSRPQTLALKRHFPTRGKRLSTIASVETFATEMQAAPPSETEGSEATVQPEPISENIDGSESRDTVDLESLVSLNRRGTSKRKLASHADLISVLSLPRGGSKSIVSARSIRTNRSRLATATIGDIMNELASDEAKYMRELRTLVDGVIPVLLACVLSKSDAAVAAGLFSKSALKSEPNVTRPIVDMGVSLERLKALHRRIPKEEPDALLSWAQSAQRIYSDYVKAWRLGFQDVVVNLAPADEGTSSASGSGKAPEDAVWDEGMPRNEEGYVVNGDGERVDVAFLLKRPLVRLKYLAKTFKGINHVKHSLQAEKMSMAFQELVNDARKRSNEERARLEDEAASNIDPTRARDPRSLAPLAGVKIDSMRCVRARDYFDMHLPHSSGQEVDCRVELLIRDDAPGRGTSGDVLLCEVDESGRSLFFPPIQLGRISARNGDQKGEIIVMMRGFNTAGHEWNEVFSLISNDEQAGFEWVQMLGLQPVPPQITEIKTERSFISKARRPPSSHASSSLVSAATGSTIPIKSRTPSPREVEVPFGERANPTSKKWDYSTPDRPGSRASPEISPVTPPSSEHSKTRAHTKASPVSPPSPLSQRQDAQSDRDILPSSRPKTREGELNLDRTPKSLNDAMMMAGTGSPVALKRTKAKRVSRHATQSPSSPKEMFIDHEPAAADIKPLRKPSRRQPAEPPYTPTSSSISQNSKGFSVWMPSSEPEYSDESDEEDMHPIKPALGPPVRPQPHRRASSTRRRSSSPLKHEYEPSTATESSGESEGEIVDNDSLTSDSSEDELEDDIPMPMLPRTEQPKFPKVSPPASIYSLPNGTISPSQSASNTPYRAVPQGSGKASKAIASITCWSNETGKWESLYPDECSIVVTPGKIEAYELTAAHSKPLLADGDEIINSNGKGPLVCQEVTPLVILRKGTAIDITVKSLPTSESRLKCGEQIMYRSRNPEECDALYNMINISRCNNPTWIALQQARGSYGQGSTWAAAVDRQNAARSTTGSQGAWWNLNGTLGRRSSYRASSTRAASISAVSDSSVGTMTSAFSALKRFSGSSRLFNVAKSTISSRDSGGSTGSLDSGSAGSGSGTNTPNPDGTPRAPGAPQGITNTKIRLYERESLNSWRDMGSARLTIMLPDPNTPRSATRQGQGSPGLRQHGSEKRIVIVGKAMGEMLMDVTLSESCFERVARTGIAISVWEDVMGPSGVGTVGAVGGVSGARARVYMVQMKTERECAYSYSLLGKLRY